MRVSASIVTYNSSKEIIGILDSLYECLNVGLDDVYLIDNNSTDNTISIVKNNYSWVKLIESNTNLGYGAGHNKAIQSIESDIHFIINPDIILNKEEFKKMINYMNFNSSVAIVSPKVLNSDGSVQYLPKKNPKLKYLLGSSNRLKMFREEYTMQNIEITNPVDIEFCSGCFMICRTKFLKLCGGFDDRYFLYFEDADLSRMLKKYGRVIYNPNFYVIHMWKRENRKSLKGIRRFIISYIKYKNKWKME